MAMNIDNDQTRQNEATCCVDYCKTSYKAEGGEVVNYYKCNQRPFSTSDMWGILKQRKQFPVNTTIGVN